MTTPWPFPTGRSYESIRDLLGEERTADLVGSREVVELAVHPEAQGHGLGRELLRAIAGPEVGPAWLVTAQNAVETARTVDPRARSEVGGGGVMVGRRC